MAAPFTLVYFPIRARSMVPLAVASYAGLPLVWEHRFSWGELKPTTVFGQLPVLKFAPGSPYPATVAQSLAIVRVLARMGGLTGATDAEFALSEMMIQEAEDIYMACRNASQDKPPAWKAFFDDIGPRHLGFLEKLVLPSGTFTGSVLAGDLAVYAILKMVVMDIRAAFLVGFPKVAAFFDKFENDPKLDEFRARTSEEGVSAYFRPS